MKTKITLLLCLLASLTAFGQTYIKDVTVVDVINKQLIPAQTVVISKDLISAIKPLAEIEIPTGAKVVNASGKFLMPGLTDAHVHFFQSGGLYSGPDGLDLRKFNPYENEIKWVHANMDNFLRRYMRAGVTTVVDVGSTYNFLKLRDSLSKREHTPYVYMTGPLLTTWVPEPFRKLGENDEPFELPVTPTQARKIVQKQLAFSPDFIKIWYIVDTNNPAASARKHLPIVKAVIDEAHKNNLKVAVHATERYTAQLAVESGCDFLVHSVEDELVSDEFVKLLKAKKTILCPTLIVTDEYYKSLGQRTNFSFYELTKSDPQQIGSLFDLKHLPPWATYPSKEYFSSAEFIEKETRTDLIRRYNLKKLADNSVIIVAGTDAGNMGTQHATSLVHELIAMQSSGLTSWQVLEAATINAAKLFDRESTIGSVSVGKNASLVLLNINPLNNLENLTAIDLVFHKGNVINPDTLIRETPLALVQRQLNAYNARNIDAFLEPYAEDVELYTYPDKLTSKGKESMRTHYAAMFEKFPDLHCEIKERTINGNVITDKELVSGKGKKKVEATAIYHIVNDKIAKVYFIR